MDGIYVVVVRAIDPSNPTLDFDSVNHVWSQQLLSQGIDANFFDATADGRTPLQWAAINKHSQVVKLLISKGTD